ncbi:TonB family protein [Deltaproteobacteria bacterium]|nr:TonB family protein [Deltaproteobacteria bacterium]
MKASLVISFVFHVIILLVFQKAIPFHVINQELRTYRVELIRPPVDDMDKEDLPGDQIDHEGQNELPEADASQDTISLDTKDKRYISYASLIKNEIMLNWRYPPEARAYLMEGRLTVLFSLSSDGRMTHISVSNSSENEILDNEVIRAINSSVPFPSFPESITVKRLNIRATFDYRLTSEKTSP